MSHRLAKQRNIHDSRQQEATVSVLRCSLDDVSMKLKDKTCDGERLGKELQQLQVLLLLLLLLLLPMTIPLFVTTTIAQGQYAAAMKNIEELTHDKGKLATENLKLQVQKENCDQELKSRSMELAAKDKTVERFGVWGLGFVVWGA